ncbi:MAG: Holliday junction branch migration protein RuvA [Peptostreptococcaceae bacterium]
MYSYIKGTIEDIELDFFVIENNNIGYKINASSNTINNLAKGNNEKIYTKLIVKEDDMSICGFLTKEELNMFNLLTSVSKIGVKVGLAMLSFATPKTINGYIFNSDVVSLSKCPGIGKKTAERMILELKDKVDVSNIEIEETLIVNKVIDVDSEAVEALLALGYTLIEAKDAVKNSQGKNTEETIKKSLSYILSKSL